MLQGLCYCMVFPHGTVTAKYLSVTSEAGLGKKVAMGVGEGGQEPQQQNQHHPLTHHTNISLPLVHLPQLSEMFSLKIGLVWSFCCVKLQLFLSLLMEKNTS